MNEQCLTKTRFTVQNSIPPAKIKVIFANKASECSTMISILHRSLDLVMLMSYDYHELNRTSINAPLSRENNQNPYTETVSENVERLLAQGCQPSKIVMGIPTYGRTYTLRDSNPTGVDASVDGLGEPGPYTLSHGSLGFNEVTISSTTIERFCNFTFPSIFVSVVSGKRRFAKFSARVDLALNICWRMLQK